MAVENNGSSNTAIVAIIVIAIIAIAVFYYYRSNNPTKDSGVGRDRIIETPTSPSTTTNPRTRY